MPFQASGKLLDQFERHEAERTAPSAAMAGGLLDQVQALGGEAQPAAPLPLSEFITLQAEGLCGALAKLAASRGQTHVRLSSGQHFEPAIDEELLTSLELDRGRAKPLLDRLHQELHQFASAMPRHRDWGYLTADSSGITLAVDTSKAGWAPPIDQLPPEAWTVLS
jgi:hypothetical protein